MDSQDAARQNGIIHAERIKELIEDAMRELLPMKGQETVAIDPPDEGIITIGGSAGVTIEPEPIEVKTIAGTITVPGWTVSTWHTVSNYPHSPDDVDQNIQGQARTPEQAAALAIQVLFNEAAERHWENVRMAALAVDDLF